MHALPPVPQAPLLAPPRQSSPWQQPFGQVVELQLQGQVPPQPSEALGPQVGQEGVQQPPSARHS